MFEQNYLQFHYKTGRLEVKAFPPKTAPQSPALEAEKTAFYYSRKFQNKKIILCMSGGLDSEAMAESFLRAGAPFQASIWQYKHGLNLYDIKHAVGFCKKHKINYEIEQCDLELFYERGLHFHYGEKYSCNSPQLAVHLHLIEKLSKKSGAALLLPWEPPSFYFDPYSKKFLLRVIVDNTYLSYLRAFQINRTAGQAYFLISRSALLYSFLRLPIVKSIMNRELSIENVSSYKLKTIMYKQGGFAAKPKKGKWTGFDKIRTLLEKKYGMDYNEAFRFPLIRRIPDMEVGPVYIYPVWKSDNPLSSGA